MNLDEAIEILTKERHNHHSFPTDIIGKAEQLGIEAMTAILQLRTYEHHVYPMDLPGETKE